MKIAMMAAAAALLAAPAAAQEAPAAPAATLVLPGATVAPDCGNLYGLAGRVFCVTAPLAGIGALAESYVTYLGTQGWTPAGGEENRVLFVRPGGSDGCAALEMQAFYDTSRPAAPDAPGYLAFGPVPGVVCTPDPAPAAPAQ